LRLFLKLLGTVALIAWGAFYWWIHEMACAFSTSGGCRIHWPWQLNGEDFVILVLAPGALVVALFGLAAWLGRRAAKAPDEGELG